MLKKKLLLLIFLTGTIIWSGCRTSPHITPTPKPPLPSDNPEPEPSEVPGKCGSERWSVKTGTDVDAVNVQLNNITRATIDSLVKLPAPTTKELNSTYANSRISPYETNVYQIDATLTKYKLENDNDYHLVIQNSAGKTMIVEIPKPDCVGQTSPFLSSIIGSRKEFDSRFTVTNQFKTVNIHIVVTGVAFFDFKHGQTGVADNAIELHPVLNISF